MGRPARPLHEPGNHHSSERCSPCHSADCGSLIEQPTLLRVPAPTPRPGARSNVQPNGIGAPDTKASIEPRYRVKTRVRLVGAGRNRPPCLCRESTDVLETWWW